MKYNLILIATALLLSTLLIASSCKKDKTPTTEEQLPPETQTGAFTIGFKVDGKIYTAKGKGGLLSDQSVYYSYLSDSVFNIGAGSGINNKFNLYLNFKCFAINSPSLLKAFPFEANFQDKSISTAPGISNSYNTDLNNTGSVVIKYFNGTFNPLSSGTIVSGIFEFNATNGNGKIIRITEGRFDIGR